MKNVLASLIAVGLIGGSPATLGEQQKTRHIKAEERATQDERQLVGGDARVRETQKAKHRVVATREGQEESETQLQHTIRIGADDQYIKRKKRNANH